MRSKQGRYPLGCSKNELIRLSKVQKRGQEGNETLGLQVASYGIWKRVKTPGSTYSPNSYFQRPVGLVPALLKRGAFVSAPTSRYTVNRPQTDYHRNRPQGGQNVRWLFHNAPLENNGRPELQNLYPAGHRTRKAGEKCSTMKALSHCENMVATSTEHVHQQLGNLFVACCVAKQACYTARTAAQHEPR